MGISGSGREVGRSTLMGSAWRDQSWGAWVSQSLSLAFCSASASFRASSPMVVWQTS